MIIQIRGTHGAGKTTVVRKFMQACALVKPVYLKTGRRIPIAYRCYTGTSKIRPPIMVLGSYENTTGGCDTIRNMEDIFSTIMKYASMDRHVVCEGIVAQHSFPRMLALRSAVNTRVRIIRLTTPLDKCIRSTEARRRKRGQLEPLNPFNLTNEYRGVLSSCRRLKEAGFTVIPCTRRTALDYLLEHIT